nr:SDR family NAD(P)-dependent oxidoreductase [Carbonactinospora thermoautotrophica]
MAALDLHGDAAEKTVAKIAAAGGRAIAVAADVTVAAEMEAAFARAVEEFGRLDVLYNNAGVDSAGSVADASEDDWDRCFAVNVKGPFLCSRAAVPHLEAAGGGAIVNQASVAGLVGVPNLAAYCAAKGAVISLTRSMAIDLAPPPDPSQRNLPGCGVHSAPGATAAGARWRRPHGRPCHDGPQVPDRPTGHTG